MTAELFAVKPPVCAESIELVSNGLWLRALTFASFFAASRKAPERPAVCSTVTSRCWRGGGEVRERGPREKRLWLWIGSPVTQNTASVQNCLYGHCQPLPKIAKNKRTGGDGAKGSSFSCAFLGSGDRALAMCANAARMPLISDVRVATSIDFGCVL